MNIAFVYGSLKSGHWNNHVLGNSEFLGKARTVNTFFLTDCGFPYLIPPESLCKPRTELTRHAVVGEAYNVTDEAVWTSLDRLEGVAYNHYKRENLLIFLKGKIVEAQTYTPCEPEMALQYPMSSISEEVCYSWP